MVASLLKIVSTGMQDERLQPPKGQPRLSSFLTVLVKTGRYTTNWVRIDFDTAPDFGKTGIVRLPTKGEMIGRVMLVANMPDISTRQIEAYYTRKPRYLANSNYIMLELYKNRNYVRTTKFNYPTSGIPITYPVGDLGIATFMGVQLDDLSIGGLYSITSSLPLTDTSTASFSMTLTDKPFDTEHIDILNKDTFLLGGLEGDNGYFKYSYNGLNWQNVDVNVQPFISFNRLQSLPQSIRYNGYKYAAAGTYSKKSQSIYIYSTDDIVSSQPSNSGSGKYIAYNGSQYICTGSWYEDNGDWLGCISYSTDGISWSPPVDPIDVNTNGICKSVAWVPSRNCWIAVGRWIYPSPIDPSNYIIYMIAKSSDGITWIPQTTLAGNTLDSIANTIAVNGLTVVVGGTFVTPYPSSIIYSTDGGNTWSYPTGPGGPGNGETRAVAWTGYTWVAAGMWIPAGTIYGVSISVSSDGITWPPATNPLGALNGDAYTIGLSPTEMVIGGQWLIPIPGSVDSTVATLSKASNIAQTYKFGPLIRPTQILNDIVNINGIALDPVSGIYVLVGSWVDVNGQILGSVSITTDITRWPAPFNPIDNTVTSSQAFAATTALKTKWVVVGYWRYGGTTKGQSIVYSDDITGTTWNYPSSSLTIMTCVPIYGQAEMLLWLGSEVPAVGDILLTNDYFPAGTYITNVNSIAGTVTVTLSSNCINPSNPTFTVISARTDIEGYATNVINDSMLSICIVTGSWTDGYLRFSNIGSVDSFSSPLMIPGTNSGTAYSVSLTLDTNTYIVAGLFTNSLDNSPITLANITVTYAPLQITVNTFINPLDTDLTKPQVAKGVIYNSMYGLNSMYVAVGQWTLLNGTIATIARSTDGITWSKPINPPGVTSSASITGLSVSWNGFQFVATGVWGIGTVSISLDGITWTRPADPPESVGGINTAKSVVWNQNTYNWVMCGNWATPLGTPIGNLATLEYGINFKTPVNPEGAVTGKAASIIWNPNTSIWIAATDSNISNIWTDITQTYRSQLSTSSDGITWSTPFMPRGVEYLYNLSQITVIENRTYIIGQILYLAQSIMFSPNGLDWTLSRFSGNMYGDGEGISWNGSIWVLVGRFTNSSWGSILRGPITTSTDGITWTNPIVPDIPVTQAVQDIYDSDAAKKYGIEYRYYLFNIAWNGTMFLAVGYIQIGIVTTYITYTIGCVVTSSDGITWTVQTIPVLNTDPTYTTQEIISGKYVAWNGQIWVVVGNFGTYPGSITSSSDGISWTDPVFPGHTIVSGEGTAVAWSGSIWVAIGYWSDVDGHQYYITTSTDGITWTTAIDPGSGNINSVDSITWNGTMFIITGSGVVEPGIIITSLDGLTWSVSSNPNWLTSITSKRVLPYVKPQPFDLTINADSYPQENGYIMTWVRHPVYGTGTQYFANITSQNRLTFTFTATSRTQWLTFGTYYNSESVVDISLNLIQLGGAKNPSDTSLSRTFKTDLVGPHFGWVNGLGHSLIDTASITIGGNLVETIPGQLMEVLDEFQTPLEKVSEKNRQLCRSDNGFNQTTYGYSNVSQEVVTHIPFWFSRGDPGCVLPIDALNVDEVRLTINFKPLNSLYYTDSRTVTPAINVEGGGLWPMLNSQFYYQDSSGVALPNLEPNRQKPLLNPVKPFPHLNMPNTLSLQDTYLLVEYIYLDKAEANRFRIADIQVPIVQHYTIDPVDTNANTYARIPLDIPNPTRDLFFFCQRYEAPSFNAHFLATRDLTTFNNPDPYALWWPDASGLDARYYGTLKPGFSKRRSEPIRWLALNYAETLNRYSTENVGIFRSMLPSLEQRKAPWLNKYIYNIPFGCQNGLNPISTPLGEANLDKVQRINLSLGFHGKTGDVTDTYAERFWVRVYAETYNIFRVYGGRGAMMFAY